MDTTEEPIRHLSLCSGYEGIGTGLRRVLANVREIALVEIEAFAIANLVSKMEANEIPPCPVFTDLKEFPFRKFRGCVDILSGGFPCQPFSAAGKQQSTEDPRHLFPHILEGIKECQPGVVFLENVEGIISCKTGDGESVLHYVLRELERVGYSTTAGIFSASEVGAPHQRKRVFIMGHANSDESPAIRSHIEEMLGLQTEAREDECPPISGGTSKESMGNPKHDGQSPSEIRGSTEETGSDSPQGAEETLKPAGASEPEGDGDLQGGESEVLADTDHSGDRTPRHEANENGKTQVEKREQQSFPEPGRFSKAMADTDLTGLEGRKSSSTKQERGKIMRSDVTPTPSGDGPAEVLAHSDSGGGREDFKQTELRAIRLIKSSRRAWLRGESGETPQGSEGTNQRFPARPGEEQYEWEHPRTIKRRLGGATDGPPRRVDPTANRVDRLRLLGNGVLPACVSRAFVTLFNRLCPQPRFDRLWHEALDEYDNNPFVE